jgi:hypothetical protein
MPSERFEVEQRDHFALFKKLGESEVRVQLEHWQERSRTKYRYAQEWLRLKDEERALASSSKRDAREEETLKLARRANIIAITAAIFAALATISAAVIGVMYAP